MNTETVTITTQVLREAVDAHEKEAAEKARLEAAKAHTGKGGKQIGDVLALNERGSSSVGGSSKKGSSGGGESPGVAIKSLASSHLHEKVIPTRSPFGEMPKPAADPKPPPSQEP